MNDYVYVCSTNKKVDIGSGAVISVPHAKQVMFNEESADAFCNATPDSFYDKVPVYNSNCDKYILIDKVKGNILGHDRGIYSMSLEDAVNYIYDYASSPFNIAIVGLSGKEYSVNIKIGAIDEEEA